MKKIFFIILMTLAIGLTACSPAAATAVETANNELPIESKLAVGTLNLAGTKQDFTSEQAQELVVLWETYKQVSQSETAAQAEIDGLITQIQETMTDEQIQAIEEMQITQQDVFASMQGITVAANSSNDTSVSLQESAGMPSGEMPPDGAMPADFGGETPAAGMDQTVNAQAGSDFGSISGVSSPLVEAVIQSLQQIIAT